MNWLKRMLGNKPAPISGHSPGPIQIPIDVQRKMQEARPRSSTPRQYRVARNRPQSLEEYAQGSYSMVASLATTWTSAVNTRREYYKVAGELGRYMLSEAILNIVTDDLLNADENGNFFEFQSDNPEIQTALDRLSAKFDFNTMIDDICPDWLNLGEYTWRLEVEKDRGILRIVDDVDMQNVVAMYEQGIPSSYLHCNGRSFDILPPHQFAHFVAGSQKIRVRWQDQFNSAWGGAAMDPLADVPKHVKDKLPDYVRFGRPFFYGAVSKIRELQLLENLIPAQKLNQVTQSQIVGIKLPNSMDLDSVEETLQFFEQLLNAPLGINMQQEVISMAEIMSVAGKIRVIPDYSDGRGGLENLNIRQNQSVDDLVNAIDNYRRIIMSSMGIPPSLLYGTVETAGGSNKVQELHIFSRYTRRLARLQQSLKRGLKQIALIHLANSGFRVKSADVTVRFLQPLVDLSGLETLEFQDAEQAIIKNTVDLVQAISDCEILDAASDKQELVNWFKSRFDVVSGGFNVFGNLPSDFGMPPPPGPLSDTFGGGPGAGGIGGPGGGMPPPSGGAGGPIPDGAIDAGNNFEDLESMTDSSDIVNTPGEATEET